MRRVAGDYRRIALRATFGVAALVLLAGVLAIIAPVEIYLWLKAFHVVAGIGWIAGMAGILYVFAWHAGIDAGSPEAAILTDIEQRTIRVVVNPGMVIAWGVGLWLAWQGEWFVSGWLQAKLVLVMFLSGVHGWVVRTARNLAAGERAPGVRLCIGVEFVSVMLAIATIVLAVVKPNVMEECGALLREPRSLPMFSPPPQNAGGCDRARSGWGLSHIGI